ncbi:hypothetical protein BC332_29540 [Capsicum chinense]|nr:hypothetical protein BC332_29540 [Capsicum chinense]
MRNRGEAAPKFIGQQKKKKKAGPALQICKGKSILETSNSHTDQMDVDQEPAVYLEEEIIMNILSSGDYKILRICDESNEILALKVGSWRKINKHTHGVYNAVTRTHSLAFVREAFHWIGNSRERGSIEYSLVSFCISKEMYGEIPLPEEILSLVGIVFVGVSVLDGMLCVHATKNLRGFETLKLWALKDYGVKESWSADPLIYRFIPRYRFADGELLFSCIHLPSDEPVFRTSSGPFLSWPDAGYVGGVAHTESLISPRLLIY